MSSASGSSARSSEVGAILRGGGSIGPVPAQIDDYYYTEPSHAAGRPVRAQLARRLAAPEPKDRSRIADLPACKGLVPRRQNGGDVVAVEQIAERHRAPARSHDLVLI